VDVYSLVYTRLQFCDATRRHRLTFVEYDIVVYKLVNCHVNVNTVPPNVAKFQFVEYKFAEFHFAKNINSPNLIPFRPNLNLQPKVVLDLPTPKRLKDIGLPQW